MQAETTAGMRLVYAQEEREAARVIGAAMEKSAGLLAERWDLYPPADCRVYVMTAWLPFLFHAAPWLWKAYLALVLPMITWRASEVWAFSGGWSLSFGNRRVVGIKPERLIRAGDASLGEQIYAPGLSAGEKVQAITCHELTHAFTAHLRLPFWLNEGLAMLAMEYYLEQRIVREDTRERLTRPPAHKPMREKRQALVDLYARGYWLARYLDENHPDLLHSLLAERMGHKALKAKVAAAFGVKNEHFWDEIAAVVDGYFAR